MTSQINQEQEFRLLVDPQPCSGQRNMAIDETLLQLASQSKTPTLRLYEWSEPTVSLGYFQKEPEPSSENSFKNLPFVRRLSGGGAILHHHELTYSFVVPQSHILSKNPSYLYHFIHQEIIKSFQEFKIFAAMRSASNKEKNSKFLCFGRGDANDIMLNGHKIVGSAQRRRKGNTLQHGSILIRRSEHAPEFPGLEELAQCSFPFKEFKESLIQNISNALVRKPFHMELNSTEEEKVDQLIEEKYRFLKWSH